MIDNLDLFSPTTNENGVVVEGYESLTGASWEICVMQFPDGSWRSAPRYHTNVQGLCWPLTIHAQPFADRDGALKDSAKIIRTSLIAKQSDKLASRIIADMNKILNGETEKAKG